MRLISPSSPAPPLLNTAVSKPREIEADGGDICSPLKGDSLFSGHGRGILLVVLGAVLLSLSGVIYNIRQQPARRQEQAPPKPLPVATPPISAPKQPEAKPVPTVVNLHPDLFHASAISLGNPRLAIINGRQVTEGDQITVHAPAPAVDITLLVQKIYDGRIELSDGTQVIGVHLDVPVAPHRKP